MATVEETLRKLGLSAARGIPQLATGFVDLAALPFTMTGVMKPEQAVGSTAYLTSKGLLPPPQEGLLSETTELVSSAVNPATATKAALAKGGLLAAPMALSIGKNTTPSVLASVNPAETRARSAIDKLVTQVKAYGVPAPGDYSKVPIGSALADLNYYLGMSTDVAKLSPEAQANIGKLYNDAENAAISYRQVYGENKLFGKPEAAIQEGAVVPEKVVKDLTKRQVTKALTEKGMKRATKRHDNPWVTEDAVNRLKNKQITYDQYIDELEKNRKDYFDIVSRQID